MKRTLLLVGLFAAVLAASPAEAQSAGRKFGRGLAAMTTWFLEVPGNLKRIVPDQKWLEAFQPGARHLAAYRKWLGLEPVTLQGTPGRRTRLHKVAPQDLDLSKPLELVVLSVKERSGRCRLLASDRVLTCARAACGRWPGEISPPRRADRRSPARRRRRRIPRPGGRS